MATSSLALPSSGASQTLGTILTSTIAPAKEMQNKRPMIIIYPTEANIQAKSYKYTQSRHLDTLSTRIRELIKVQNSQNPGIERPNMKNSVSPESVIVPIVSCILGFPLLALMVICCLRRRAKLARERARRRNCGVTNAGLSLVRLGAGRVSRTPSIARAGRERPSLDLATVLEERSDPEQTMTELMTPDRDDRLQLSELLSQPARYFLEGGR